MIARPYKVRKELAVRFGLALLLLKPVIGPSLQELSVRVNGVPTMTRAEDSLRSRARSCRPNRLIINLQVCPVGYTGAQGIAGGPTEVTEVSGTGIELVPNLNGVLGGVLRSYRAVRMASVGYLPNKYPRYTSVRTLPNNTRGFFCSSVYLNSQEDDVQHCWSRNRRNDNNVLLIVLRNDKNQ